MRVRVRVTTSGSGFCGFCGSFSQVVDIAYFSRFLACGSRVVFACGFVVMWFLCGFWIARSALRVRNGKSPLKAMRKDIEAKFDACPVRVAHCEQDG